MKGTLALIKDNWLIIVLVAILIGELAFVFIVWGIIGQLLYMLLGGQSSIFLGLL